MSGAAVPDVPPSQDVANQEVAAATGKNSKMGMSSEAAASTFVSNADQLKEKAPKVYQAMIEGIARRICDGLRKHAIRLKEIMREGQRRG